MGAASPNPEAAGNTAMPLILLPLNDNDAAAQTP